MSTDVIHDDVLLLRYHQITTTQPQHGLCTCTVHIGTCLCKQACLFVCSYICIVFCEMVVADVFRITRLPYKRN